MKMLSQNILLFFVFFGSVSCQENAVISTDGVTGAAVVEEVRVSGSENNYNFSVTLRSPDTGCDQYANWWEVVSADGQSLIYRRILVHSHIDEQPFTRSGGVVDIGADTEVIVRGHMHPSGYGEGEIVMKGSVANGFKPDIVAAGFGQGVETVAPLPNGCAF
jgi:hypothetical protein